MKVIQKYRKSGITQKQFLLDGIHPSYSKHRVRTYISTIDKEDEDAITNCSDSDLIRFARNLSPDGWELHSVEIELGDKNIKYIKIGFGE